VAEDLTAWIGNREEADDLITEWPVSALRASLDINGSAVTEGTVLDPLWHWLFFLPTTPHSRLGTDGHAELGGFLPPIPLPRRMFAGGRFEFLRPLRVGDRARRVGSVVKIEEKQGRSGRLVFVTVRHEISTDAGPAVIEEQDLVYREASSGQARPEAGTDPLPDSAWHQSIEPDEVMLFRFSALTFNGHRIHYDQPFVTNEEGYPGLIVHGPLIAMLLAGMAQRSGEGTLRRFSFRAVSPLFCNECFTLHGGATGDGAADLSAWSADRRLAMTATAEFVSS
jgi:3-methylfumaryl-CoA hydratase